MQPSTARKVHLCGMAFWGINAVGVWFLATDWRVPYLIIVSIYANFVGHWSGYSAERPTEIDKSGGTQIKN